MDAAARSAALFDDPGHWARVEEDVPIFAEHESKNPDGSVKYRVGRAELDEAALRINQAWERKTPVAYALGHSKLLKDAAGRTTGFADQKEQPPVAAFGSGGAYVGRLGQALALFQRKVHYRKDHWPQARECVHRSAEYYWTGTNKGRIPVVALLKTPAELDLGVTVYHAGGPDGLALYALGMDYPGSLSGGDPTKDPDSDDEPLSEDKEKFHRLFAACYPALALIDRQLKEGPPSQPPGVNPMAQPPAAPPAQPVAPPQAPPGQPPAAPPAAYQPDAAALAQYQARVSDLEQRLADTQTELKLQQYQRELEGLAERHVFDVAKELKKCGPMDRAAFDAHKADTISLYGLKMQADPGDPTGPMIPVAQTVPTGAEADFTPKELARATQYMAEFPGGDWEEAWAHAEAYARSPEATPRTWAVKNGVKK